MAMGSPFPQKHVRVKQAGLNSEVLKDHVLNVPPVPELEGDAPVGAADDAVFYDDICGSCPRFRCRI